MKIGNCMKRIILAFVSLLFLFAIFNCSSIRECIEGERYLIEYSTGGGFTGFERGLTIQCTGKVKFWERKLDQKKNETDSLFLSSSQLGVLDAAIRDKNIFSYKMEKPGNYTALLKLIYEDKTNNIKFNPAEVPSDMPIKVKTILNEIEKINKAERR